MRIMGMMTALIAIVMCMTMAQVVWAEEPEVRFSSNPTSDWWLPEVDDHPPIETSGRAAFASYVGCDVDDCGPLQFVRTSDGLPGYLEPAPASLSSPEQKPYYDYHVEGSHRVLAGFLVMEQCQCSEPGYVIRHRQMLLKANPEDFRRVQTMYLGTLRK